MIGRGTAPKMKLPRSPLIHCPWAAKRVVRFGGEPMSRLFTMSVFLFIFSVISASAQPDGIDHGATGTLNLDYFNPSNDPHIRWLKGDLDGAHTKPAIRAFAQGDLEKAQS